MRLRDHLLPTLEVNGDVNGEVNGNHRPVLRSRAGDFEIGSDEVAAIGHLLDHGRVDAEQLGLDLSRRMIMAGLAVVE